LGEFSPIVSVFTFGGVQKATKVSPSPHFWAIFSKTHPVTLIERGRLKFGAVLRIRNFSWKKCV
jgi:hypothetical protein